MSRLRWRTLTMSIVTRPVFVPNSAACRATCATLALQISFLLGMQLTFGQEPPIQCRSTTAVRRPECARCQASSLPPAPLPRMSASNCAGAAMPSSKLDDADSYGRVSELAHRGYSSRADSLDGHAAARREHRETFAEEEPGAVRAGFRCPNRDP